MTLQELAVESRALQAKRGTEKVCDPCRSVNGRENKPAKIVVNEQGLARYMVITEDGRWIPAEDY